MRPSDTALSIYCQTGRTNSGCWVATATTLRSKAAPAAAASNVPRDTPNSAAFGQTDSRNSQNVGRCASGVRFFAAAAAGEAMSAIRSARRTRRNGFPTDLLVEEPIIPIRRRKVSLLKDGSTASLAWRELFGPGAARERVEHGVDHAAFVEAEESGGDVHIFLHHHPRRNVRAAAQFIESRAQDRPHERLDPSERPAAGERRVDPPVDRDLV